MGLRGPHSVKKLWNVIAVRVDNETRDDLDKRAAARGVPLGEIIRELLREEQKARPLKGAKSA